MVVLVVVVVVVGGGGGVPESPTLNSALNPKP